MGIMYKLMKHRKLNLDLKNPHSNTKVQSDRNRNRNRLITIEGNIIEAPASASQDPTEDDSTPNMDSTMEKQFTAEHIMQLCKFLAEKSKKKKNLHKEQQSPKKLIKLKQPQFAFEPMEYNDNDAEVDFYQNEALPLLSKQKREQRQGTPTDDDTIYEDDDFEHQRDKTAVLSTRLSPDINSLNISANTVTATSCALQHHQQQQPQYTHTNNYQHQQQNQPQTPQTQGKRDILLKIRRQIIERKRLRENGAFEPQALNNSQVWRPW